MSIGMDSFYTTVRNNNPELFATICAFASTFGHHEESISIKTRYQVERFCMELVAKKKERST